MKDSEFFELLNLYLDHEISAADAARLETEVQSNAQRRVIYHDYCRMQKACTLLAKDFVDQPADRKVVAFDSRRSAWTPGLFATGGLVAAAACVALVMINRTPAPMQMSAPDSTNVAVVSRDAKSTAKAAEAALGAAPAPESATLITRTVTTTPVRRSEATPVPLMLGGTNAANGSATLVAAQQNSQEQFEWMKNVQLAPIQQLPLNELRLDARSPLQPATRTYMRGQPADASAHWVAFRFQK